MSNFLSPQSVSELVSRMELWPKLLRRQQEEYINSIVTIPEEWVDEEKSKLLKDTNLADFLNSRGWSESDFCLHICRPEALRLFSLQHFGPGLEELFLSSNGAYDEVIYSILRVRDK